MSIRYSLKAEGVYNTSDSIEHSLNERLVKVEKFVNRYKGNMISLENILNRLIEQNNVEKTDASTQEDIIQEPLENDEPPIVYSIMIPVLIIVISFLYAIYADRKSFAELELRFNNNSFGNKLMM